MIPQSRPGRYVGHTPSPTASAASGVWTLREHESYVAASLWPGKELLFAFDGTGSGVISLGSGPFATRLLYVGSGATTSRVVDLCGTTGGGIIESSGTGPLVFSEDMTVSVEGEKTLTLTGSNTAANAIASIPASSVSLVKSGSGRWVLTEASYYTGSATIAGGTLVIGVNARKGYGLGSGALGAGYAGVTVGDESPAASGSARLLMAEGVRLDGLLRIPPLGEGATQSVAIGGDNASGVSKFPAAATSPSATNYLLTGRDFSVIAKTGGVFEFGVTLNNYDGSYLPDADVTLGGAGFGGTIKVTGYISTLGQIKAVSGVVEQSSSSGGLSAGEGMTVDGAEVRFNRGLAWAGGALQLQSGIISGGDEIFADETPVVFGTAAIASPGNPIGTQDYSCGAEFASGGTLRWHLADWDGSGSQFSATGGLSVTATTGAKFTIEIVGITGDSYPITEGAIANWDNSESKSFTIATSSALTGFAAGKFAIDHSRFSDNNSLGGGSWSVSASGNDIVLTFTHA